MSIFADLIGLPKARNQSLGICHYAFNQWNVWRRSSAENDGTAVADNLTGNADNDNLAGGGGADIFNYVNPTDELDNISEFLSGTDTLQFTSSNFGNVANAGGGNRRLGYDPDANTADGTIFDIAILPGDPVAGNFNFI